MGWLGRVELTGRLSAQGQLHLTAAQGRDPFPRDCLWQACMTLPTYRRKAPATFSGAHGAAMCSTPPRGVYLVLTQTTSTLQTSRVLFSLKLLERTMMLSVRQQHRQARHARSPASAGTQKSKLAWWIQGRKRAALTTSLGSNIRGLDMGGVSHPRQSSNPKLSTSKLY